LNEVFPATSEHAPLTAHEASALFAPLAGDRALVVAVSGGPDSVALLALLAEWAAGGRCQLHAVTVDHGLRPEAADEASLVAALCGELGVPHRIRRRRGEKPQTGLQEKARAARYALLAEEARALGAGAIVTAHTLDDQAETLLMRMAAGSGLSGLAGMALRGETHGVALLRPLLGIPKSRLLATCAARGLAFARDPSNADPRFARVRWRELLPELAREGLGASRLGLLAERLARADAALQARAAQMFAKLTFAVVPEPSPEAGAVSLPPARGGEGLGMGGRKAGRASSSAWRRAALPLTPALPTASGGRGLSPARPASTDEHCLDLAALCREPDEIVIRVLALALAEARAADDAGEAPLRLARLEDCALALAAAGRAGRALRRTLGGFRLSLSPGGALTLSREGERRRGIHPAME
jgi:tRNA(Ile)-lysidine synthase